MDALSHEHVEITGGVDGGADGGAVPTLPTLMIRGKLVNSDGVPTPELSEWIPYEYILDWFKVRKELTGVANRVLILRSETASGKSTLLPPKIYEEFIMRGGAKKGVICTQPRVYTAINNVQQMLANYKFLRPGQNIGWSTKENKLRPARFGLVSATIGTLTQQLKTLTDEEIAAKYMFILIDETHERDLQTDMALYMLKSMLLRMQGKKECPFVVLMSATFEPAGFLRYYGVTLSNFIWCKGEAAGFDEMWNWNEGRTVNNYTQAAATIVEKICDGGDDDADEKGDILIFLPGAGEFRETAKYLEKLNAKYAANYVGGGGSSDSTEDAIKPCPITGGVCKCGDRDVSGGSVDGGGAPNRVFSILQVEGEAVKKETKDVRWIDLPLESQVVYIGGKKYIPKRRIVMSTTVAETGVTINSLKYVIDAGFNRGMEYNPVLGVSALLTKPAEQSRIKQRKGRAGRKFRGVFYPLYPQFIYDKLPPLQPPQIINSDVTPIALDIVFEQLRAKTAAGDPNPTFRIADIDMIDPPAPDAINAVIEKLFTIGFLTFNPQKWPGPTLEDARGMTIPVAPPLHRGYNSEAAGRIPEPYPDNVPIGFTRMGAIAAVVSMPTLAPEFIRVIFAAYSWGVDPTDVMTMAAFAGSDPEKSLAAVDPKTGKKMVIDWPAIYKESFGDSSLRILTADELIDGIALFHAARKIVSGDNPINALEKWCGSVGVSKPTLMRFIAERDSLINHFLANEFAVFGVGVALGGGSSKGISGSTNNTTYMDTVTRLKHCIYDGFKCSVMILDDSTGKYKTSMGLSVKPPKFLQEKFKGIELRGKVKPVCVIATKIGLKYNRKLDIYEAAPGLSSVMDGFVAF